MLHFELAVIAEKLGWGTTCRTTMPAKLPGGWITRNYSGRFDLNAA
jgi:hypothetical protein